jgi:hypothetical protein
MVTRLVRCNYPPSYYTGGSVVTGWVSNARCLETTASLGDEIKENTVANIHMSMHVR